MDSHQVIRLRRSLMGLGGYAFTLTVVMSCYLAGVLPGWVLTAYAISVVLINATFFGLIYTGLNLRLRRPDMTLEQVVMSVVPGLFAIYYIEAPLARAAFLLLAVVPMIFGILGLDIRRSLLAGLLIFSSYVALIGLMVLTEPQRISPVGDTILLIGFLGTILQIALLGGYMNGLRLKLRARNAELHEAMDTIAELVNRDDLTGTFNRRYLLDVIERESDRSRRGAGAYSVAIFDVDHFKNVNDGYGHLAGDRVLTAVAETINTRIRKIDCFGRYGGEEFLLIMPQTELAGARHKAEQLRAAVAGVSFETIAPELSVTVSAGVATHLTGEPFTDTIRRADHALYAAKENGRNRVMEQAAPAPARA